MNDEGIRTTDNVDSLLGNPEKALWRMSIPLIISLFITSLYNLIDAIWVAGLGADALAGVGFVTPIFIALMGIGNGLGAGSASALSKYIGEGRKKKADNGSIHSIIITVLISILTTIFLMIILSNSLYGVLRGEGDANRSMYAMLFSSILNMVLDPIFIYGLNLGVEGAAIATVISLLLVNLILLYWFYIKKNTYLKPFLSNFKFNWNISFDILKVGLPASLELINNALFAGIFSLLLATVASTDAVAVYSTGWRVVTIGTTPMLAIATALISVVGANYGARKYEDIKTAHRYSIKISTIFGIAIACLIFVFAPQIAGIFTYSGTSTRLTPSLVAFLSTIVLFLPTMGYGATSTYVFQGTGRGITAMFQTILRETVFSLAFAYFFAVFLGYGEYGAWFGIIAGELVVNTITMIWADRYIKSLIENNGEKR